MIQHKQHYFGLAGLAVASLGLTTALFRASPLWPTLVAAVLATVAVRFAHHAVWGAPVFAAWPAPARRLAVRWIVVAAVADVAAVGVADGLGPRRWLAWLVGVAALTAVQIGAAHVLEVLWLRLKPAAAAAKETPGTEVAVVPPAPLVADGSRLAPVRSRSFAQMSHDERVMHDVLTEVGYGWLVMCGYEEIRDVGAPSPFGAAFLVRVPASVVAARGDKAIVPTSIAEPIAIALGERLGILLPSTFVAVRKQDRVAAGLYRITVVTEDVMGRIYPYRDPVARQSIQRPAPVGFGIDTKPVHLLLAQHGQHIGKSRWGKSSLIHVLLAYMTLCAGNDVETENCVVFVCGTEKLFDLVGSWLKVYEGTGVEMPFEWVARGPEHTLSVLLGLLAAARYRQSVEHENRSWPTIICILDEASFALRNDSVVGYWDGQPVTMSDLAGMNAQGSGSADCWLHTATQRDTNDQHGTRGGDITAQAGFTSAFNTSDFQSIGRMLGDFKLASPTHKGEFWLAGGESEDGPELAKAPYIQEIDPSKPRLHAGDTIADVSWRRRLFPRRLDEGTADAIAAAVGDVFTHRARVVTREFLDYLRGVGTWNGTDATDDASGDSGRPGPVRDAVPLVVDEVCAVAEAHGMDVASMTHFQRVGFVEVVAERFGTVEAFAAFLAEPTASRTGGVPAADAKPAPCSSGPGSNGISVPAPGSAPKSSRVDAIVEIVAAATAPMRSADIIAALAAGGYYADDDISIYNQLGRLVKLGKLVKADKLYDLPGRVYAHVGSDPT